MTDKDHHQLTERLAADNIGGIVVGDDGSESALAALRFAFTEAALRGVPVNVIRAWQLTNAVRPSDVPTSVVPSTSEFHEATEQATNARVAKIAADIPAEYRVHVVHAPAIKVLVSASDLADLLVVGARGVGGLAGRLIGSVAESIVRESTCPVTVVHRKPATPKP